MSILHLSTSFFKSDRMLTIHVFSCYSLKLFHLSYHHFKQHMVPLYWTELYKKRNSCVSSWFDFFFCLVPINFSPKSFKLLFCWVYLICKYCKNMRDFRRKKFASASVKTTHKNRSTGTGRPTEMAMPTRKANQLSCNAPASEKQRVTWWVTSYQGKADGKSGQMRGNSSDPSPAATRLSPSIFIATLTLCIAIQWVKLQDISSLSP